VGTWYEYIGSNPATIDLTTADFSDESLWSSSNPITRKAKNFVTTLTSYLSGDFGFSNWIGNTWSQATASGEELTLAGSVTFLELDNNASALIKSGAQINQKSHTGADQDVVVFAVSDNDTVNLAGNIELPAVSSSLKPGVLHLGGFWVKTDVLNLEATFGGAGVKGKSGAGLVLMGVDYGNSVIARIEDGVKLHADTLQVTADNNVLGVNVGASGGKATNVGFDGTVGLNLVPCNHYNFG
jgi:hypothetical protein